MTKGLMLIRGQDFHFKQVPFGFGGLRRPRKTISAALALAAAVAIFAPVHAAETMTYPEPQIVPVDTADYYGTSQISGNPASGEMAEPPAPGEGPPDVTDSEAGTANNIDVITIGENGSAKDFWKPEVHFGATVGAVFQDNVFITNNDKVSDVVLVASGRVTVAFGNVEQWASRFIDTSSRALAAEDVETTENLVAITYAPTANFFIDNDNLNSVDQDVAATLRWTFSKLQIAVDARLQTLSDPDEDLGRRSDRTITRGSIRADYAWSDKTSVEVNAGILNRDYDVGVSSVQLDSTAFILYQLMPKTRVGFGLGAGELEEEDGDTITTQQALLRLRYDSFSKLVYNVTVGGQLVQNLGGGDQLTTVFQLGVTYLATNDLNLFFSAYRRIEPSASGTSLAIERTTAAIGLSQRLLQKVTLGASLDYTFADYASSNDQNINSGREDKLWGASTTLTFEVTQNGFVRVGYQFRKDDSSLVRNSYGANQVLVSFTALF